MHLNRVFTAPVWSASDDCWNPSPARHQHFALPLKRKKGRHTGHPLFFVVGAAGFEPTTPCTQNRCATRLRHAPITGAS